MMKKLVFVVFIVLGLATLVWAIEVAIHGEIVAYESLNVKLGSVTTITSTIYQPGGTGTPIFACLVEPKGAGYYRLDYYSSVSAANYTPTVNDFITVSGTYLDLEQPQWFRMTPSAAAFSAPVISHGK
jgi:hypothetical protein